MTTTAMTSLELPTFSHHKEDDEVKVSLPEAAILDNGVTEEKTILRDLTSSRSHHVLEWNIAEIAVKIPGKRWNFFRSKEHKQPARQKIIVRNVGKSSL